MTNNGYGSPLTATAVSDGSWINMAETLLTSSPLPLYELGHEAAAMRILQLLEL